MTHSIHKRLEEESYYKHQTKGRDLYPWELARERQRVHVMSKEEFKKRMERDLFETRPPANQPGE